MIDWPSCAKKGCPWPAAFKVQMENDAGPFSAYLCLMCIIEVKQCLAELSAVGEEQLRLLEQEQIKLEDAPMRVVERPKE
jgi:hypothetical protein